MNIVQLSISLYCCIQSLHSPHFKTKVACICIPKNHVNCIDLLHLIFWIWDERPSRWVNLLLSHKGGPLGTSTYRFSGATRPRLPRAARPRLKRAPHTRLQRAQGPLPLMLNQGLRSWARASGFLLSVPGPSLDLGGGGGATGRAQPEEEAGLWLWWGGYHTTTMHTEARFHPGRCKDTSVDHAHQHNHSYTDVDDVAT